MFTGLNGDLKLKFNLSRDAIHCLLFTVKRFVFIFAFSPQRIVPAQHQSFAVVKFYGIDPYTRRIIAFPRLHIPEVKNGRVDPFETESVRMPAISFAGAGNKYIADEIITCTMRAVEDKFALYFLRGIVTNGRRIRQRYNIRFYDLLCICRQRGRRYGSFGGRTMQKPAERKTGCNRDDEG